MKIMVGVLLFLCMLSALGAVSYAADTMGVQHRPFWQSDVMDGETLFFIKQNESEAAIADLLFVPDGPITVTSSDGQTMYQEGVDYIMKDGSRTISLPTGSRIPFKTAEQMRPMPGSPQSIGSLVGGKRNLFWSEGHVFHDLQVKVVYSHKDKWTGYMPTFSGQQLPKTLNKLTSGKPINLVVLGDSISEGYNASKFTGVAPFQPPYPELVAHELGSNYKVPVNVTNLSVAGKTASWGATMVKKVVAANPDLVCIAFGMNDASSVTPIAFSRSVKKIMDGILASCPDAEFILVATMTGNSDWSYSAPKVYPKYHDELVKLTGQSIVLADVTTLWTDLLKVKKFADLTGNGVNHPNDFGHRLYADILLALLIP